MTNKEKDKLRKDTCRVLAKSAKRHLNKAFGTIEGDVRCFFKDGELIVEFDVKETAKTKRGKERSKP